jgi:hypothetical protein
MNRRRFLRGALAGAGLMMAGAALALTKPERPVGITTDLTFDGEHWLTLSTPTTPRTPETDRWMNLTRDVVEKRWENDYRKLLRI